jgi:regulator of protease activity HflC (stomatin/prohibitin superfamily)
MKRSEMMAWTGLVGLLAIGLVLLAGGVMYNTTTFWAGMLLAFSQAIVCGLAGWGLMLARQRAELQDLPETGAVEGFRMSFGNETDAARGERPASAQSDTEIKTLDTGFQRMLVGITAVIFLASSASIIWMIYNTFEWARKNGDKPFPIAGALGGKPVTVDELGLVIGLGAAIGYFILSRITRPRRREAVTGEAVASNFTLGLPGMLVVGLATAGAYSYFKIAYAAEVAGAVIAVLLALQGLEIFVNAFRSFSAVEELDQEAVDLHALPLVPMLGSVWLSGMKMLFAQSFGLAQRSERGVMGRMMPRAIAALVVIAILISCVRVVKPGEVAVLERLGYAKILIDKDGNKQLADSSVLHAGLHFTMPWPIDELVTIPTNELQTTNVGAELHAPKSGEKGTVDFQFWTVRTADVTEGEDNEDQFITGDVTPSGESAPQMLETYVVVMWRVADPSKFYTGLSHSEFFFGKPGDKQSVPIYEALVQQCTGFAVTRTFAIHKLDDIMTVGRSEVEGHCKRILQEKLDEAKSGIQIVDLTIKDLHPPFGKGLQPDPTNPSDPWKRGPAHAYENVVSARELKEMAINRGEAAKLSQINLAKGDYAAKVSDAESYRSKEIAKAQGDAARLQATMAGMDSLDAGEHAFMLKFAESQAMFRTLRDVLAPVGKVVLDPKVPDVTLWQQTEKGGQVLRPPGM